MAGARRNRPTSMREKEARRHSRSVRRHPGAYLRDVPVGHGRVLLGDIEDTRNLDNLILRQLHVVFLKFHNEAVRQLETNPALKGGDGISGRRARCSIGPAAWSAGITNGSSGTISFRACSTTMSGIIRGTGLAVTPGSTFSIPIEFSLAAFRFGHSMVRNAYRLNCRQKRVVIGELMALGQAAAPIPDDYLIEWGTFFDGLPTSGPQASSAYIDTSLSGAMHGLSPGTIRLANELESPDPSNLPVRTLLRGARAQRAFRPGGGQCACRRRENQIWRSADHLAS